MPDRIAVDGLRVDCLVGITEEEQRTLQPLEVDLEIEVDLEAAAASGDLGDTVGYAGVAESVRFLAEHGRWRLIESLAAGIARLILAPAPPGARQAAVERVRVRVRKPEVLHRAVPSVLLERAADWCELGTRMVPEKTWLDTLVETPDVGAYRAHVEPDSAWIVPPGAAALVLSGVVDTGGRRLEAGRRIARGEVSRVRAAQAAPASLLVVASPPVPGGMR